MDCNFEPQYYHDMDVYTATVGGCLADLRHAAWLVPRRRTRITAYIDVPSPPHRRKKGRLPRGALMPHATYTTAKVTEPGYRFAPINAASMLAWPAHNAATTAIPSCHSVLVAVVAERYYFSLYGSMPCYNKLHCCNHTHTFHYRHALRVVSLPSCSSCTSYIQPLHLLIVSACPTCLTHHHMPALL